jgi:hypothetical protein
MVCVLGVHVSPGGHCVSEVSHIQASVDVSAHCDAGAHATLAALEPPLSSVTQQTVPAGLPARAQSAALAQGSERPPLLLQSFALSHSNV